MWETLPPDLGGSIFSFVIVNHTSIPEFKELLPYVLAIVSIDGTDVRLIGRVLCDSAEVRIGDQVAPVFAGAEGGPVINWSPKPSA